jgi:predicted lactoylglutathione lyase
MEGKGMSKQVFINLPVNDLAVSTAFYKALGFTQNDMFSDEHGSCMVWSDEIMVMLLTHDFYQQFIAHKTIVDTHNQSGVLLALSMESREAVQTFADAAKQLGGNYYAVAINQENDQMFGYEVEDLDGHIWEPIWMDMSFNPKGDEA